MNDLFQMIILCFITLVICVKLIDHECEKIRKEFNNKHEKTED